jgi:hypothetical protein
MQTAMTVRSPRAARVGDRLPSAILGKRRARQLDATALLVPGRNAVDAYLEDLRSHAGDFAAWDGAVTTAEADGEAAHRLLIVDRYRQVYAVHDAAGADQLPSAEELVEWFRFLSTACPECGVIDDPTLVGPTP